jgi:hypothetical protein
MRCLPVVLVAVFLGSPAVGMSQETLQSEDLLKWFPAASFYERVEYFNFTSITAAGCFALYQELFAPGVDPLAPLPPSMREGILSCAYGRIVREMERPEAERAAGEREIDDVRYETEHVWVYLYSSLERPFSKALQNKEIERQDTSALGRPVFKFASRSSGAGGECFAWALESGELLVADKLENLLAMVDAGAAWDGGVLSEPDYAGMTEFLSNLGPRWDVIPMRPQTRNLGKEAQRSDPNFSTEELENSLDKGQQFQVHTFYLGDDLVECYMTIYGDIDSATEAMAVTRPAVNYGADSPQEMKDYYDLREQKKKRTLEGTRLIVAIPFDEELIVSRRAFLKASPPTDRD